MKTEAFLFAAAALFNVMAACTSQPVTWALFYLPIAALYALAALVYPTEDEQNDS